MTFAELQALKRRNIAAAKSIMEQEERSVERWREVIKRWEADLEAGRL